MAGYEDLPMAGAAGLPPGYGTTGYFPPAPTAQPRYGSLGGLGGAPAPASGAGGFLNSPNGGNLMTALGLSLLSSPRNAPLAAMAQILPALNRQKQERQQAAQKRQALKQALVFAGADLGDAEKLSADPTAAELWMKQKQSQTALASDAAFNQSLLRIEDGGEVAAGEAAPGHRGAIDRPPLPTTVSPAAVPSLQLADGPVIAGGNPVVPGNPSFAPVAELPAAHGPTDSAAPASPDARSFTPEAELRTLEQMRRQYERTAATARTDDQRQRAKIYLDGLDRRIQAVQDRIKPTGDMRELEQINTERQAAGMAPLRLDEWLTSKSRAGATNVNVGKGETAYDEERGKQFAKDAGVITAEANVAQRSLGTLDLMDRLMSQPGFYSGAGGETVAMLKQWGQAIGLNPDGISSIETFNALSKQAALEVMGGSLGTGFSNADRDFVTGQVPTIQNTPQGNKLLIEVQRRMARRKVDISKMMQAYEKENNGRIDAGFYDRLGEWAEANPLFDDLQIAPPGTEGRAGDGANGAVTSIVNPQTGERMILQGNQWVPAQ